MMLSSKYLSMIAGCAVAASLSLTVPAVAAVPTLTVYHVGNSVTDTINYGGLGSLVTQAGGGYTMGRHMIPGAPLEWLWKNQDSGFTEAAYGAPNTAFVDHKWDVITLQPFDRQLGQNDDWGDRATISRYVNLALQNADNRDAQVYIYSRWPRRAAIKNANDEVTGYKPFNFQEQWDRKYTGGWDGTNESRDYFKQVLDAARTDHGQTLAKRVLMVPVGDVLYEIDKRAKQGLIPGLNDVELEAILEAAREAGVKRAGYVLPEAARFMNRDVDFALSVFNFSPLTTAAFEQRVRCQPQRLRAFGSESYQDELIGADRTDCFRIARTRINAPLVKDETSAVIAIVTAGSVSCEVAGETIRLHTYDKVFFPAGLGPVRFTPHPNAEILECFPPIA